MNRRIYGLALVSALLGIAGVASAQTGRKPVAAGMTIFTSDLPCVAHEPSIRAGDCPRNF